MAVQIYSVSAMGMTRTGHLLWCGNPPQIIPLKLQFIKMDKHKKGYFSLLLEEYRVTEGWVYWLMMELANGFQERTRIPWWDNIAWLHCMLNSVHKKEQMHCKIVKRVILCSQQVIHTVIGLHCVEYILIHKPVYRWNDLLWRIILHNPGFRYVFIIFSLVSLIYATVICIYWRGRFYANKCISLFKKRLSFFSIGLFN